MSEKPNDSLERNGSVSAHVDVHDSTKQKGDEGGEAATNETEDAKKSTPDQQVSSEETTATVKSEREGAAETSTCQPNASQEGEDTAGHATSEASPTQTQGNTTATKSNVKAEVIKCDTIYIPSVVDKDERTINHIRGKLSGSIRSTTLNSSFSSQLLKPEQN